MQDLGRRQFLLTNLKKVEKCAANVGGGSVTHEYVIRLPVEVLGEQLSSNQVGDFPFEPTPSSESDACRFARPSLFIKGAHSKYINKYNIPTIAAFFADHKLVMLDTDHWGEYFLLHLLISLVCQSLMNTHHSVSVYLVSSPSFLRCSCMKFMLRSPMSLCKQWLSLWKNNQFG
jgi:hypothetical protein